MDENEMIVCEFLRKIAPSREWKYLGEVEHYWISQLCDELNKQLKAENVKLRDEFRKMDQWHSTELMAALNENVKLHEICSRLYQKYYDLRNNFFFVIDPEMDALVKSLRELGIKVD